MLDPWADKPQKRGDRAAVLEASRNTSGFAFQFASEELRANRELLTQLVGVSRGIVLKYAPDSLRADRNLVVALVERCGLALEFAAESLRADSDVVQAAVKQNCSALKYASRDLRTDPEFVLELGRLTHGFSFQYASRELRNHRQFAGTAVRQNGAVYQFCTRELREDSEFELSSKGTRGLMLELAAEEMRVEVVISSLGQCGQALGIAAQQLQFDVILAAMKQCGFALDFAANDQWSDREFVRTVMSMNWDKLENAKERMRMDTEFMLFLGRMSYGAALEFAEDKLLADRDFVIAAIRQRSSALEFADKALQNDRDFVLSAVSANGSALEFVLPVYKDDPEVIAAAAKQRSSALKLVSAELLEDREFCLGVVSHNLSCFEHIGRILKGDFEFKAVVERLKAEKAALQPPRVEEPPVDLDGWSPNAKPDSPAKENAADNVVPRKARGNRAQPRFPEQNEAVVADEKQPSALIEPEDPITDGYLQSPMAFSGSATLQKTLERTALRAEESKMFTHDDISAMTDGFKVMLGSGGCGTVFRGRMTSGTPIAVKRLEPDPGLGAAFEPLPDHEQLKTEVVILSRINHPNIVPLLGSSTDGPVPCLIYALMEGGALNDRLDKASSRPALTTGFRLLILSDIARGLVHLHSQVHLAHRDVKSANVLLDRGDIARIGDFGIARNVKDADRNTKTQTHVQTQRILGTLIYMAPEYKNGELSTKVDSFAFGLVILETLTGLPVSNPKEGRNNLLAMYEEDLDSPEALTEHLDPRAGSWAEHTVFVPKFHGMVERCLESRRKRRCEIAELVPQLEEIRKATEALRPAVPQQYRCQLTGKLMKDPVVTAGGNSYERAAIEDWLRKKTTDPVTGAALPHQNLAPAIALRQLIDQYCAANPEDKQG